MQIEYITIANCVKIIGKFNINGEKRTYTTKAIAITPKKITQEAIDEAIKEARTKVLNDFFIGYNDAKIIIDFMTNNPNRDIIIDFILRNKIEMKSILPIPSPFKFA